MPSPSFASSPTLPSCHTLSAATDKKNGPRAKEDVGKGRKGGRKEGRESGREEGREGERRGNRGQRGQGEGGERRAGARVRLSRVRVRRSRGTATRCFMQRGISRARGDQKAGRGWEQGTPLSQLRVQLVELAKATPHDPWPDFASQLHLLARCALRELSCARRHAALEPGRGASGLGP